GNHDDVPPNCDDVLAICCIILGIAAAVLVGTGIAYLSSQEHYDPFYSVAIESASGLDVLAPDLTLDPEFNLTLRITSQNHQDACAKAGMYVEVSYRCVILAASPATSEQLCAKPPKAREAHFLARGPGVRLPGYIMDNLMADVRNGVHAFDVVLRRSDDRYDNIRVESCGGRRAGGNTAAALETRCQGMHLCPDQDHRRSLLKSPTKHVSGQSIIM
uniref:Late embryogenesis abundant protein LEA-2 subgroup domain-containing protein n=1 Tax=Aegilops tauschii subsp. strangulata TaxID=200361 RepID=A0A453Q5M7_AEGTS